MPEACGLECLYPGPNSSEKTDVDIVAIHGLNGNRLDTWTHEESKKCWLRDFLPECVRGARILTYGYDTGLSISSSQARINDIASHLIESLLNEREGQKEHGPIIFVAHSLGGIILKQSLILAEANNDPTHKSIAQNTAGIFFFGTPHQGSDAAAIPTAIDGLLSTFTHKKSSTLLANLRTDNEILFTISSLFRHQTASMKIVSLYELESMGPKKRLIVTQNSAILNLGGLGETIVPVTANHSQMCKFKNVNNDTFRTVCREMKNIIKNRRATAMEQQALMVLPSSGPKQTPLLREPYGRTLHANFVDRPDLMKEIMRHFIHRLRDRMDFPIDESTPQKTAILLLHGIAGSGKSQLAHRFFKQRAKWFRHRIWIDASSEQTIVQEYQSLAREVGIGADDVIKPFVAWLKEQSRPWLLVLDDVHLDSWDGNSSLLRYIPETSLGCVLVTSPQSITLANVKLEVKGFTSEQSCDFIVRLAQRGKLEDLPGKERLAVQELVNKMSNMPLAIDIAGTFLQRSKGFAFTEYLHGWEENVFSDTGKAGDSTGYGKALGSALQMTFREAFRTSGVDPSKTKKSTDALELLRFFSHLCPGSASERILKCAWSFLFDLERQIPHQAMQGHWLSILTPAAGSRKWPSVRVRAALILLSEWSLASFDGSAVYCNVFVHSLVQKWVIQDIRNENSQKQYQNKLAVTLAAIGAREATNEASERDQDIHLVLHLDSLTKTYSDMNISNISWPFDNEAFMLSTLWADIYMDSGNYARALELRITVYKNLKHRRDKDVSHYAVSLDLLGTCYHDVDDHETAYQRCLEALKVVQSEMGRGNNDAALWEDEMMYLKSVARELHCLGHTERAAEWHLQVLKRWRQYPALNGDHRAAIFEAYRDYASSLLDIGKYERAMEALSKLVTDYGYFVRGRQDDKGFLLARSELARAFSLNNKHQQACRIYRSVLEQQRKIDKKNHDALIAAEKLAISLTELELQSDALQLRLENIHQWYILQRQSSASDRNILAAKFNLARNLELCGYVKRAITSYEDVLNSHITSLAKRHDESCRARASSRCKRDIRSREVHVLLCPMICQISTSDAVDILVAIAFAYEKLEEVHTARSKRDYILHVCEIKSRFQTSGPVSSVARESRREAFLCRNQLAAMLENEDDQIRAREDIATEQRKHLGDNHKDTLITTIDLGRSHLQKKEHERAAKYARTVINFKDEFDTAYPSIFESAEALLHDAGSSHTTGQEARSPRQMLTDRPGFQGHSEALPTRDSYPRRRVQHLPYKPIFNDDFYDSIFSKGPNRSHIVRGSFS